MKEFFKWLNNWLIQANQRLEITSKELEKKKIEVMQELEETYNRTGLTKEEVDEFYENLYKRK